MTISTSYAPLTFNGNDATTAFAVSWQFFDDDEISVTLIDSDGVETAKTLTTHYTVAGGGDDNSGAPSTGTVTMLTAPATGETLRIERSTIKTRASINLTNVGAFDANSVEWAVDRLVMIAQEESGGGGDGHDGITGDVLQLNSAGAQDYWDAESNPISRLPFLEMTEAAAPDTPDSGYGRVYTKTDGDLYHLDDTGTETNLTDGAATAAASATAAAASATSAASSAAVATLAAANVVADSLAAEIAARAVVVFDIAQAIYENDPDQLGYILAHDQANQDVAGNTDIIRGVFDDALTYLQGGDKRGAIVKFPPGKPYVDDELLSDTFQAAWWAQTSLGKGKFLVAEGDGPGVSMIQIDTTWVSGVRNSANGNERTYGPWANEPSPASLFPIIANPAGGAPASFSLRKMRMVGTDTHGKDPVPWLAMAELDARSEDLHVVGFANWGEFIGGSYNSIRARNHFEGCGAQPVESGAVLGGDAGWPTPRVRFDYDSSTNTLTAKAGSDFSTYTTGDPVPFFLTAHVGKTFVIHQGASHGGVGQPLKATIATVASDGVSTATVTVPAGVTDRTVAGVAGSFMPVKATTTAASGVLTLSAPVKVGRGAADMVGQLVAIPKAGSTALDTLDVFCSRIASCDTGNDTDGYTQITLTEEARDAVTEDLIWSAAHSTVRDEASLAAGTAWGVNDTDFNMCRWEHSGGYGDDVSATGYQWIVQPSGASQYVSCKVHGCSPVRGSFAAEGLSIIDNSAGLDLIGMQFTHFGINGAGIRAMGAKGHVRMLGCGVGGWQLAHDWHAFLLDPQSGYDPDDWSFVETDTAIDSDTFPFYSQGIFGKRSGLTNIELREIFTTRYRRGAEAVLLDQTDDLDDLFIPGQYRWLGASTTPANAPFSTSHAFGVLEVVGTNNRLVQRMTDLDNDYVFERDYFDSAWSGWRLKTMLWTNSGSLGNAANLINTTAKFRGAMHWNQTDGKLYVAQGSAAPESWISADGATTITPS